jgi:hypothetical protein
MSCLRSAGMYMQEALDLVCRKRKLDPRDYALVLNDNGSSILIPLDRTVASLQGKRELLLVKRNMLSQMGIEAERKAIRTTDPNGKCLLCLCQDRVLILYMLSQRLYSNGCRTYPKFRSALPWTIRPRTRYSYDC